MITKIKIKNFKRFKEIEFDLDSAVVLIGPNNCGKTTALQAITLFDVALKALRSFIEKSNGKYKKNTLTINRKDLITIPTRMAKQIWHNLHVREGYKEQGKQKTKNILLEIIAEGETRNRKWKFGFEFDYANPESFYCRPIQDFFNTPDDIPVESIGYLPPMSGLASVEERQLPAVINSRIGEGRTAEVLRNLCYSVFEQNNDKWKKLKEIIFEQFRIEIENPVFDSTNGQIYIMYKEHNSDWMDITNSGRGFQQILLIFAFLFYQENTILLLDEPDAHLEIIRQQETYRRISDYIQRINSQLIIATHSEAILNQAKEKDKILAFIGKKPKLIQNAQYLLKALKDISYTDYILAEQKKWVLYLEGETDFKLLQQFAIILNHPVTDYLTNIFVYYISANQPTKAREHFYGLQYALENLQGIALFDNSPDTVLNLNNKLKEIKWKRREIENYIPIPSTLFSYIETINYQGLFSQQSIMLFKDSVKNRIPPIALEDTKDSWWIDTKMSDEFLDKIFRNYFDTTNQFQGIMDKSKYYLLLQYANPEEIDPEVKEKLDAIYEVAMKAEEIIQSEE
jgi:predicted ATPase